MEERLLKKLMSSIKCGSCGQCYESYNIDILGHNDDMWFLRAHCKSCHSHSLVVALIKDDREPEIVTDHTEAELDKFKYKAKFEGDDVLEMHRFLKKFSGDFSSILEQK